MDTTYTVSGMTCGHCVDAVRSELGEVPGVSAVRVDRTVWHSWPGSNGWALMPGNKTADDINNYPVNGQSATWWSGSTLSVRNLSVWVTGGTGYWCTSDPGTGWTGHWRDC